MERSYKCTITTLDGKTKEITLRRLTVRDTLRLGGQDVTAAVEVLIDQAAPGVLDIISPASFAELNALIMETEKDFFDQWAKMLVNVVQSPENSEKDN